MILTLFTLQLTSVTTSQTDTLNLEAEQNWDTYGIGGTCTYNTQNLFVGDVDGDGVGEILTGGFSYYLENGTRISMEAPLKVWTWNGQNVTLKASTSWNGSIYCLFATDLTKDGNVEIICGGSFVNENGDSKSTLRVLNLSSGELNLLAHYEGIAVNSLFVSDVDKDGVNDLLTVSRYSVNSSQQLSLWHIQGSDLTLVDRFSLSEAKVTSANSIFVDDVDNDGDVEIIVAGYSDSLENSKGLISIWHLNDQKLELKAMTTWQLAEGSAKTIAGGNQGNTAVNNVKAADLDGDGRKEIVTAGFAYDSAKVNAQIKVWHFNSGKLIEHSTREWASDYMTEAKSIALNDVNGDGKVEIVQSGITAAKDSFNNPEGVHDRGQLRVWSYSPTGLGLIVSKDWTFDEGACAWNVGVGDVDNDGAAEIITVGCSALMGNCDPDMRIWSLPLETRAYPSYLQYAIALSVILVCAFSAIYLYFKRTKRP